MFFDRLCRWLARTRILFLFGCLLCVLIWLLREWLAGLWLTTVIGLILLGLLFAALVIGAVFRKACWKRQGSPKGRGSVGHPWTPTKKIPSHTYKRPDPMIYSQSYLTSKGLAVTWDNPDIQLFDNGLLVSSNDLQPNRAYRLRVRIWNGSTEAPAVNMLVKFFYLSYGIGTQRNYIGQTFVDVPVKGAPGHPAFTEIGWTTPATPGHYCLQAELVWPDDANPDNNLGQENVNVKKLNSPNATFAFSVRNEAPFVKTIHLEADAYMIPPRKPCGEPRGEEGHDLPLERIRAERQAAHLRESYPIPHGWGVEITPVEFELQHDETQAVTVKITSDGNPIARQAINVNAFASDELVGGVTLYVRS